MIKQGKGMTQLLVENLHKSYGMKVTDERIALVNQISLQHQWKLEIEDLFDAEGKGRGTRIVLF